MIVQGLSMAALLGGGVLARSAKSWASERTGWIVIFVAFGLFCAVFAR